MGSNSALLEGQVQLGMLNFEISTNIETVDPFEVPAGFTRSFSFLIEIRG